MLGAKSYVSGSVLKWGTNPTIAATAVLIINRDSENERVEFGRDTGDALLSNVCFQNAEA